MHANTTHAIYWAGNSSDPFPANYQTLINGFLANVAADSGTRNNVYSTDIQYYDKTGNIQYKSAFAGGLVDTTSYPVVGNCVPHPPPQDLSVTFDVCLTDNQLATELDAFIAAHNLPRGLGNVTDSFRFVSLRSHSFRFVSGAERRVGWERNETQAHLRKSLKANFGP